MELLGIIAIGLVLVVYNVKGETRCYCNEASCISTGYMCKSALDSCFSQLTFGQSGSKAQPRYGCVEALSEEDMNFCDGEGKFIETTNENWPFLMCCVDDMCNYIDMTIDVRTPSHKKPNRSEDTVSDPPVWQRYNYLEEKDLWFKAAVIAVPIAGGFILILLVLLAIRMLRNDSRRHRQFEQMRHRSLAKTQLYVTNHFCKRESDKCPRQSLMTGHANPYSDVNIKIDHNSQGYEKIRPASDSSTHEGSVNSVITWGNKPEKATIV